MPNYRVDRVKEDIKRELSSIFRELKDPRIKSSLVTIVRVEVSNDISQCKVYISSMEGIDKAKEIVKILKSAVGFIRHELALRLDIRHTPDVIFKSTDAIEYSANISKMLDNLKDER